MLFRIANRSRLIWVCAVSVGLSGKQLVLKFQNIYRTKSMEVDEISGEKLESVLLICIYRCWMGNMFVIQFVSQIF